MSLGLVLRQQQSLCPGWQGKVPEHCFLGQLQIYWGERLAMVRG